MRDSVQPHWMITFIAELCHSQAFGRVVSSVFLVCKIVVAKLSLVCSRQ